MSQALIIREAMGYAKAGVPIPSILRSEADSHRWDPPSATAAEKQERLYANLTWISTAVDRVADIGATAIFSVKQQAGPDDDEGEDIDLPNHEFEKVLRRPNPSQSRGEFLRACICWYKVTGNLYIYLNAPAEGAPPDELWIVPSHMMDPIPDGASYIKGYAFTAPGKAAEFVPTWKILHLKTWNPFNPFVGLSAIQSLAIDAAGDIAQQAWNAKLFAKDAGKLPVILAFKHNIANPQWDEIKRQRDEEWGGTSRPGVMLLRGVEDTMQVLQAGASQKEMDFLEGRKFTKEEIYDKLAPGLSAALAVNATDANSENAKALLVEFAVWPVLDQLSQKLTSDVLILYDASGKLVGEFDDMRPTNRELDLKELDEYAKFHVINEVRQYQWGDGPLMLDKSQESALADQQATHAENRQMAIDQFTSNKPAPVTAKADSAKPAGTLDPRGLMFVAQIGPATPLPGDPTRPPPAPPMPPQQNNTAGQQPGQPIAPPAQQQPDQQAVKAELAAWERFAQHRLEKGGSRDFEPHVIDVFAAGRIKAALKAADTMDKIQTVFANEREPGFSDAVAELRRFNDLQRLPEGS